MTNTTVGYEAFLAPIVAAVQGKAKTTASLGEAEIRAVVATHFKIAVNRVADDTDGYIKVIPVNLYEGVQDYELAIPDGYQANRVIRVEEVNAQFPTGTCVEDDIMRLPCCANKDVTHAFDLHVSVVPDIVSDVCEYDKDFINHHYQAIMMYLHHLLSMQSARQWAALGIADRLERNYLKTIKRYRNHNKFRNAKLKLKDERLTDHARTTPRSTNCHC